MTETVRRDDDPVVRPGTPSFQCLAEECGAMCCRNPYRVDLGEDEVNRLAGEVDVAEVLDERTSIVLMRQVDDACVLLGHDLRCNAYQVRPIGCRNYPFRLEVEDEETPRIVRDLACPGFVGPPMDESAYTMLVEQLTRSAR
ncbi:MAG: YkgJ family cysteine cluster protein [Chloroflexota bacterium]|nr:YkgJ family cysteine cluster protein [Chloroflexota bacterium]